MGKLAWPKGLDLLFQHMSYIKKRTGRCFDIDIYGQVPYHALRPSWSVVPGSSSPTHPHTPPPTHTPRCYFTAVQGPHAEEIKGFAAKNQLSATFHGARDHSLLTDYKVFVNPSLSEVLCTTIVEVMPARPPHIGRTTCQRLSLSYDSLTHT